MYLKNRTILGKSTKYRKIENNFLIFPKYRKYRRSGSPATYINKSSNHPPSVLKQLTKSTEKKDFLKHYQATTYLTNP